MKLLRRFAVTVVMAVTAVTATSVVWAPTPASARSYYEYWGYWHKTTGSGSWQYSTIGAGGYYLPKGKSVEGWRFAIGTASPSDPSPRPTGATYDAYCAGKNASSTYRVLLVVDYGTGSGAPAGPVYSCYGFNDSTTGSAVLSKQHSVRDSGGLVCAIDTYPHSGCGETVSSPAPTHAPTPHRTTSAPNHPPSHAPSAPAGTTTHPRHSPSSAPSSSTVNNGAATTSTTPAPARSPSSATSSPGSSTASTTGSQAVNSQSPGAAAGAPSDPPSAVPFAGAPAAKSSTAGKTALVASVIAIVLLGGGAFWRARRGRG